MTFTASVVSHATGSQTKSGRDGQQSFRELKRTLVFVDEAGFYLLPGVLKTDSPEGLTPMIPAWQTRDHQSVIGTLTSRGRVYVLVRREATGCRSPTAEPSLDSVVLQERGTNPVNFTSLRNDRELRGKYRSGVVEAQYVTDDVRLSVRCGGTGGEDV